MYERTSKELRKCVVNDKSYIIPFIKSLPNRKDLLTKAQMIEIITETIKVANTIPDEEFKSLALAYITEHLVTIEGQKELAIEVANTIPNKEFKSETLAYIKKHLVTIKGKEELAIVPKEFYIPTCSESPPTTYTSGIKKTIASTPLVPKKETSPVSHSKSFIHSCFATVLTVLKKNFPLKRKATDDISDQINDQAKKTRKNSKKFTRRSRKNRSISNASKNCKLTSIP